METTKMPSGYNFEKIVDILIRLGLLALLVMWCFDILRPFILILIWAVVIAIAVYPIHQIVMKLFRGRKALSVIVITIIMLSIIIIPSTMIIYSLYDGINHIREMYVSGKPLIPPPGANTANWPSFTKPIVDFWQLASENLQEAIVKYSDQVRGIVAWLIATLAGIGKGILMFNVSIIIAGVLLAYAGSSSAVAKKIFVKVAGERGEEFTTVTVITIRNVIKGILGVAFIQATMAGLGFFIAGVPFAGLWTVLCLILAIILIGAAPIAIPVAIYMFSVTDTTTATILAIWLLITVVSDNVLKPILLGRNAPAPMLVIFLGAIGGFIYNGFIGLFLGAVILTLGYKLFMVWLNTKSEA
jgi:predicted PurR-regulated permease PerM